MPKLTQSVPKYRRHRASGQAIVTLNGVDHYLGPHGTRVSKNEYDRVVAEWLANGREIEVAAEEITVLELVVAFLKQAKGFYGGGTRGTYANLKRGMESLKRLYGRTKAVDFGPREFKAIRQTLIDDDLSRKYINEKMRQIVQAFTWAAGESMVPATVPQSLSPSRWSPALRWGDRAFEKRRRSSRSTKHWSTPRLSIYPRCWPRWFRCRF